MTNGNAKPGQRPGQRASLLNNTGASPVRANYRSRRKRGFPVPVGVPVQVLLVSDQSIPQKKSASSGSWMSNLHLGALGLGAASTVLVALRLLSVARLNPETAYGILQAGGTGNVLIGTVMSLVPSIAIIGGLYLVLARVFSRAGKPNPLVEFARWTVVFALLIIALLTIPFRYAYVAAPVLIVFVITIMMIKRIIRADADGKTEYWLDRNWGRRGTYAAVLFAFLVALLLMFGVVFSPPWMPAERLTLNNHQTITGYVLSQTSDGATVMQAKSRKITYYAPGAIKGQAICSNAPPDDFPLIYYIKSIPGIHLSRYDHC